ERGHAVRERSRPEKTPETTSPRLNYGTLVRTAPANPPPGGTSMSVATEPTPPAEKASPCDHPYRITIDLYHRLAASGIFRENAPIYLWKGRLIEEMTKGRPHTTAVIKSTYAMIRLVPEGWYVQQEQPITISDDSEPEPDLTVVRGGVDDYPDRPPSA